MSEEEEETIRNLRNAAETLVHGVSTAIDDLEFAYQQDYDSEKEREGNITFAWDWIDRQIEEFQAACGSDAAWHRCDPMPTGPGSVLKDIRTGKSPAGEWRARHGHT